MGGSGADAAWPRFRFDGATFAVFFCFGVLKKNDIKA